MSPRPGTGRSGTDTSSQVLPSSLVSLIRPLLVPTQITPRRTVDSASDWIAPPMGVPGAIDRKSTRLNSSHVSISYAVFCLKKKKKKKKKINKKIKKHI